jgi:nicotinate-nucleotide pyrophosphorylase (carboxylating)
MMDIGEIIRRSLEEDIGYGDITTESLGLNSQKSKAGIFAKSSGVLAGIEIFRETFHQVDNGLEITLYHSDGAILKSGDRIAKIVGRSSSILKGERVALNFLQRLSGIATLTRELVNRIGDHRARLLDTRKTTPLLRQLEKYAVRVGGGYNHRFGLYDMIMLKENHIASVGSISKAIERVRAIDTSHKLEIEVKNLEELKEAALNAVDRVMLDNMCLSEMREAVRLYSGKIELEASGNVNLERISEIAATGVDFISSGLMTHSYKSMDISLIFEEDE